MGRSGLGFAGLGGVLVEVSVSGGFLFGRLVREDDAGVVVAAAAAAVVWLVAVLVLTGCREAEEAECQHLLETGVLHVGAA